eukprot:gene4841-biopygen16091
MCMGNTCGDLNILWETRECSEQLKKHHGILNLDGRVLPRASKCIVQVHHVRAEPQARHDQRGGEAAPWAGCGGGGREDPLPFPRPLACGSPQNTR